MKRKIFVILMAVAMTAAMISTAFADEENANEKTDNGNPLVTQEVAPQEANAIVTFNVDGKQTTQQVTVGSNASKPKDPTKTGYDFVGWKTETGEIFDFATAINEDITLTAAWKIQMFKVTIYNKQSSHVYDVPYGETVKKPTYQLKEREYWASLNGDEYDFSEPVTHDLVISLAEEDVIVEQVAKVTFVFGNGEKTFSYYVRIGGSIKVHDPVRKGYSFDGWFTTAGKKWMYYNSVHEDTVLYAHWVKNATPKKTDGNSPQTEDENEFLPYFLILLCAASGLTLARRKRDDR